MGLRNLKTVLFKEMGKYIRSEFQIVMKKDQFQLSAKIFYGPRKGEMKKCSLPVL